MTDGLVLDFLITSVNNIRVAEDAISALLLIFIIGTLLHTVYKSIEEGPLANRLWTIIICLMPFLLWKLIGTVRRIFIEESNPFYAPLHDFGEVMESVSALFILVSLMYLYSLLRPGQDTPH